MSKDYTVEEYLELGRDYLEKAIEHLKKQLLKIRTGKAHPGLLEDIRVEYYGATVPLHQVANLSIQDARTIVIQPWDKNMLPVIEGAIVEANLGFNPMNDGEVIRIHIPPLTEERRKQLVKQARQEGEEARISIRNARHKMLDFIKKEVKNGYPEDVARRKEKEVEDMVKKFAEEVEKLIEAKEKDIMTV